MNLFPREGEFYHLFQWLFVANSTGQPVEFRVV